MRTMRGVKPYLTRNLRLVGELHDAHIRDALHRVLRVDVHDVLLHATIRWPRGLSRGDDVAGDGQLGAGKRDVGADSDRPTAVEDAVAGLPGGVRVVGLELARIRGLKQMTLGTDENISISLSKYIKNNS